MSRQISRENSENSRVTKAAGIVGSATLLSRIFGYVRDMVFAYFFGAGMASDAFVAAFRIPNLLRRLFGEGSLSIAFVPVFTDYLLKKGKKEAFELAGVAIRLLSVILSAVAVIGIASSPLIISIIAPGFENTPQKFDLAVLLTRIMFSYILFIGLVALCMGILNGLGHFAAPALAPVLLNLAMIGAMILAWMAGGTQNERAQYLACGVIAGGILQLGLQIPFIIRKGVRFWQSTRMFHEGLRKVGILMLPTIFGAAVYQINILVGTLLASLLEQGSISYLYYADRLVQFPLGIFGIAIATAVLPSLSRQATSEDITGLKDTFSHALRLVLYITIPAMIGLIVLREPIVALLFKRGAFSAETVRLTAAALLYYSTGLWAFSGVRILVSTFYALKDTKTPVITAAVSVAVNIVLGVMLMRPLSYCGLALATSLSSIVNLLLLVVALRRKLGPLGWRSICVSGLKTAGGSVAMGVVVFILSRYFFSEGSAEITRLIVGLPSCILAGILVFILFSIIFRIPEYGKMTGLIRRRQ